MSESSTSRVLKSHLGTARYRESIHHGTKVSKNYRLPPETIEQLATITAWMSEHHGMWNANASQSVRFAVSLAAKLIEASAGQEELEL